MEKESWIDKMVRKILKQKSSGVPDDEIINENTDEILSNIFSSDENTLSTYVRADWRMYVDCFYFYFSCCDTFEKFLEVNHIFRCEIRKKRYFLDFYRSIPFKVDREVLETEYNTAFSVILSVLDWQSIHFDKHLFPYAEFSVVIDSRSTELCHSLKGLILPTDSEYLNYIFPPNFFGDRTFMKRLRRATIEDKNLKLKIDPRFAYNFAKYYTLDKNKPFFVVPNSEENLEIVRKHYK